MLWLMVGCYKALARFWYNSQKVRQKGSFANYFKWPMIVLTQAMMYKTVMMYTNSMTGVYIVLLFHPAIS